MVDPRLVGALEDLIQRHSRPDEVPVIAVSGAQGSGKSTLAATAARACGAIALSLDDAYFGRGKRAELARSIHPLFAVRGPPGTHDLAPLNAAIDRLRRGRGEVSITLPIFDKLADEQGAQRIWSGRPRAILVEGWCLGAQPQLASELAAPINPLERDEDPDGHWRGHVNDALACAYSQLFDRFDALLFLRAPGFEPVLDWRCEQEAELLGLQPRSLPPPRRAELGRFIQHFERITRSMIEGGVKADLVAELDEARAVGQIRSGAD